MPGIAMKLARFVLCLTALLVGNGATRAGTFTLPVEPNPIPRQEIFSHNGAFVLDVNPEGSGNAIYAVHDRLRPQWTLPGVLKTDVRRILLSDSGSVVALIRDVAVKWDDQGREEAIRLIDRDGRSRTYTVADFNGSPNFKFDGCSKSSLVWHDAVIDHGDHFVIRLENGKEYSLEYSTASRTGRWQKIVIAGVFCGVLVFFVRTVLRRPPVEPVMVEPVETAGPS
jgi:hypothetical protein